MIGAVGCGGDRTDHSDRNDMDSPNDDYNYRNGPSAADSAAKDSVDSVLLPTTPPSEPMP